MADKIIWMLAAVILVGGILEIIIPLIQLLIKIAPYIIQLYL